MSKTLAGLYGIWNAGYALQDGSMLGQITNYLFSSQKAITAFAGGGQASATQLTARYNQLDTVATAADSVKLPLALPGTSIFINNATATAAQVFGSAQNPENANAGDTIAANNSSAQVATGTGVSQIANSGMWYVCTTLGQWKQCSMA